MKDFSFKKITDIFNFLMTMYQLNFDLNLTSLPKCEDYSDCLNLFYSIIYFDNIRLFIAFPISILTFILNIFSFTIFMGNEFKNRIYMYLRVYCINSAFISIFDSLIYVSQRQYGNIGNSIPILIILIYVYNYLQLVSSYFNGLLDCIILIERITSFSVQSTFFNRTKYHVICFIGLVFCVIVCLPSIFYYKVNTAFAMMNSTILFQFNSMVTTVFYASIPGQIINYGIFFIKDVLIFSIENVFNIISIILLRRHFLKKKNFKMTKKPLNNKKKHFDRIINRVEEKFTILVIVMSSLSFFQHIAIILFTVYSRVSLNFSKNFLFFYFFSFTLKNFLNYFLFYFFNPSFRRKINNFCKKNNDLT